MGHIFYPLCLCSIKKKWSWKCWQHKSDLQAGALPLVSLTWCKANETVRSSASASPWQYWSNNGAVLTVLSIRENNICFHEGPGSGCCPLCWSFLFIKTVNHAYSRSHVHQNVSVVCQWKKIRKMKRYYMEKTWFLKLSLYDVIKDRDSFSKLVTTNWEFLFPLVWPSTLHWF